ncbi:MAG: lysoplasmalogenase [Candidatus Hydrogenedentes bacterium]|nr:lysoplasmalogenase [Candidatus Hydrogenedentota bacterium]
MSMPVAPVSPTQRRLSVALTVLAFVAVAGMLGGWVADQGRVARWSINTASTLYVLIAVAGGAHRSGYGRLILAAVSFCWLGDILGPKNFLLGAGMFLLAHLFLIPAFVIAGQRRTSLLAGTAGYLLLTAATGAVVASKMGAEHYGVMLPYMVAIAAMGAVSLGTVGTGATRVIPVAALLFYVSDVCLAQTAFLDGGRVFTYVGYPMYYTAVILFALTPWAMARRVG